MPIHFIRGVLKSPAKTGAIAPSSPFLAREMLRYWPEAPQAFVAEYGPGTGAFTQKISKQLGPDQQYLGFEMNSVFMKRLQKKWPHLAFSPTSAESMVEECTHRSLPKADLIVSGLPWAIFDEGLQDRILEATAEQLAVNGVFSTFAYVHALPLKKAKGFLAKLRRDFEHVRTSHVIWRNIPPAVIYHCSHERELD